MKYCQPEPNISGWMSIEELEWLFDRASKMESVIEIGSWMGRSTHALLSGCKGPVFAIDHFQGSLSERDGAHSAAKKMDIFEVFWKNVGHFKNLAVMRMDSVKASFFFCESSIDMVFIDGDHEYPACRDDIVAWLPKASKLICGHDRQQQGIPQALNELHLNPVTPIGSIWSIEK